MVRFSTFVANSWWFTKIIVMIFCAIIAFLGWFFFNTSTSYVPILSTFIASDGISKCISSQVILKIPSISSIFITRAYLVIFSIIFTLVCLQIFVFLIITPLFIPLFIPDWPQFFKHHILDLLFLFRCPSPTFLEI